MATVNPASSPRWRSRPDDELAWLQLEDDFVAFHRPSGKTHFLNAASHELIRDVLAAPRSIEEIAAAILKGEEALDVDEGTGEFVARLEDLVFRLEQLGLIERCG